MTNELHGMRLQWIDALRGFAVLGIILVHTDYSNMPWFIQAVSIEGARGVQLFFILSGFSVFYSLKYLHPNEGAKAFLIRRFFRIAPLLYVAIFFYREISYYREPPSLQSTFVSVFFLNGLNPYQINGAIPGGWVIAVEMLFYALVPLIYYKIKDIYHIIVAISIAIVFDCVLAAMLETHPLIDNMELWNTFLFKWLPNQISIFLLGIALFFFWEKRTSYKTSIISVLAMAILTLINYYIRLVPGESLHGVLMLAYGFYVLVLHPFLFALCLFGLALGIKNVNISNKNPLVYIGKISYSCYIFHFAVLRLVSPISDNADIKIFLAKYAFCLILTIIISTLSYRYIEQPGISLGRALLRQIKLRTTTAP